MKSIEKVLITLRKNHKDRIEILEYRGNRSKSVFKCSICEFIWEADTYSVVDGKHGCKKCSKKIAVKKLKKILIIPKDKIIRFVYDSGCEFISFTEKYKGNRTKMKVKFLCGHIGKITVQEFKKVNFSKLCHPCSHQEGIKKVRKSKKDILKLIKSHGFNKISFPDGYLDGKSKVRYSCKFNHQTTKSFFSFVNNPFCKECQREKMSKKFLGEKSLRWKGGITSTKKFFNSKIRNWKRDSEKNSNYQCVITGSKNYDIHHLYSFKNIMEQTFIESGIELKSNVSKYSKKEKDILLSTFKRIQDSMLGVCLRKDIHKLFHQMYGYDGKTTPEQFYEFKNKIANGEIIL